MTVSKKLLKLMRHERGWSQEQLAEITGVSERTIQRVEKDGNCSLETKMALASAFEVSPMDLEESKPPETVIEQGEIDRASITGYVIFLIVLPVLAYLLTNTHGMWEIGAFLIVDGLTLVITMVSYGVDDTIRFFGYAISVARKTADSDCYQVHIVLANQVIKNAYTLGCLTSLVYLLVILNQAPHRFHHPNTVVVEAAAPIVYAIFLVELWIRPVKHKVEKGLAASLVK